MTQACGGDGADDTYRLDACSGMEAEMPDMDEFKYRYYLVRGRDSDPDIVCYRLPRFYSRCSAVARILSLYLET